MRDVDLLVHGRMQVGKLSLRGKALALGQKRWSMKILTVSYSDINGGAAIAAYRLHRALLAAGQDAWMLVQVKETDDPTVIGPDGKFGKLKGLLRPEIDKYIVRRYQNRSHSLFSPGWLPFSDFFKRLDAIEPDIVHLHWVANGFFPVKDFKKFKVPVIWTLHDMWGFTGGCHYDEYCGKYTSACGACPVLGSTRKRDLSHKFFKKKLRAYSKIKSLVIHGPSRWMAESAKESTLFKQRQVVNIPYAIDTSRIRPVDKRIARQLLQLPLNDKLVLFGAMNATSDPRKGFKELSRALRLLSKHALTLVVFGSSGPGAGEAFDLPAYYMGKVRDQLTMQLLYSAADVTVVPSLQENLSNVIIESLSCGTPVVGFDIGGNADMIEHQHTGYLAKPFSPDELADGIYWATHHLLDNQISINCRQKAVREFDYRVVVPKYVALYEEMMKKSTVNPA